MRVAPSRNGFQVFEGKNFIIRGSLQKVESVSLRAALIKLNIDEKPKLMEK